MNKSESVDRKPVAAGRFYPASKDTLINDVSSLFRNSKKTESKFVTRAIISPHAGYVYSGSIAASAFSAIPENIIFKNIFLIGSSHSMSFNGASIYDSGDYLSPLGKFNVNRDIAKELKKGTKIFDFPDTSHINEHSLEVQLPFIWFYFKKLPLLVPVIIGTHDSGIVRKIAESLMPWFTRENLFIISSDFSHYPPYREAIENDRLVATSILSGDPDEFLKTLKENSTKKIKGLATSMCGWTSGLTLMYLAEKDAKLKFQLVDYCNSGDSDYGGKDQVVGYHAIALIENE